MVHLPHVRQWYVPFLWCTLSRWPHKSQDTPALLLSSSCLGVTHFTLSKCNIFSFVSIPFFKSPNLDKVLLLSDLQNKKTDLTLLSCQAKVKPYNFYRDNKNNLRLFRNWTRLKKIVTFITHNFSSMRFIHICKALNLNIFRILTWRVRPQENTIAI